MEQALIEYPLVPGKVIDMVAPSLKKRIVIKRGLENMVLKLEDVLLFYTENKIIYLIDKFRTKYMCDKNLSELELLLDSEIFFRANRKYILNINYIKSYKSFEKVKLVVEFTIPQNDQRVIISQETAPAFKKWIAGF